MMRSDAAEGAKSKQSLILCQRISQYSCRLHCWTTKNLYKYIRISYYTGGYTALLLVIIGVGVMDPLDFLHDSKSTIFSAFGRNSNEEVNAGYCSLNTCSGIDNKRFRTRKYSFPSRVPYSTGKYFPAPKPALPAALSLTK